MLLIRNFVLSTVTAAALLPITSQAALTLYTTSWSMYGENPYEYDGAYKNGQPYGQLSYVQNPVSKS